MPGMVYANTAAVIVLVCVVGIVGVVGASPVAPSSSPALDLWDHLPRDWANMCTLQYDVDSDVNATISCYVTRHQRELWRLADLRVSLEALVSSTGLQVSVRLECEPGGTVSLPYPMRAPGLTKLTVRNCRLLDKYADFDTPAQDLGDWMTHLDMRNSVWLNDPKALDLLLAGLTRLTSNYECGQDSTLVSYIYRNISDDTLNLDNKTLDDLSQLLGPDGGGGGGGGEGGHQNDSGAGTASASTTEHTEASTTEHTEATTTEHTTSPARQPGDLNTQPHSSSLLAALASGNATSSLNITPGTDNDWVHAQGFSEDLLDTISPANDGSGSANLLQTLIDLDAVRAKCLYARLEVQDESFSPVTNKNHFEFMVKNAEFPQLRVLNYTAIGMTEIPQELREWRRKFRQSQLGVIDLSHNHVKTVGLLPPYPSRGVFTTLVLRHNNISHLSVDLFREWALVPDFNIDIRNNPIDCNCDLKDLLQQLRNDTVWAGPAMTSYRDQLSIMRCATPPGLSGEVIGSLSVDRLPCPVSRADLRPAMAGLGVVVVVLVVLLVLAVKYRREVRILMYTRVHILLPCGVPRSPGEVLEKTYDAFVSYAHQDSDWVLGSLLKRLEEPGQSRARRASKLCIHQRDFVVGKPIIDNIIDSIAASRHTIVVLSNSFVRSDWAMEELLHAYRQSLEERKRHLVLVVLEDVANKDMTPLLRRCCQTFTYLHVKDTFFWDRLTYSIQVAANHHNSKAKGQNKFPKSPADGDFSNAACSNKGYNPGDDEEELAGATTMNEEFKQALFLETMRAMSVDSTCSTVSDTGLPVTPGQLAMDRPLFETRA